MSCRSLRTPACLQGPSPAMDSCATMAQPGWPEGRRIQRQLFLAHGVSAGPRRNKIRPSGLLSRSRTICCRDESIHRYFISETGWTRRFGAIFALFFEIFFLAIRDNWTMVLPFFAGLPLHLSYSGLKNRSWDRESQKFTHPSTTTLLSE